MPLSNAEALQTLRADWPPPSGDMPGLDEQFDWSLDGGGRHLMDTIFHSRTVRLVLEVGSFMGGSALRWLRSDPDIVVVCCDHCPDNQEHYIRSLVDKPWAMRRWRAETLLRYAGIVERYGMQKVLSANLSAFASRAIVVRKTAPWAYDYLAKIGLEPDVIFVDAGKERRNYWPAHEKFPQAIITGDDWNWRDPEGNVPVPSFACEIAKARSGQIYADQSTFVLNEPRLGLQFDDKFAYRCA